MFNTTESYIFMRNTLKFSIHLQIGLAAYSMKTPHAVAVFIYGKVMSWDIPIGYILALCQEVLNRENREVLHLGKCLYVLWTTRPTSNSAQFKVSPFQSRPPTKWI